MTIPKKEQNFNIPPLQLFSYIRCPFAIRVRMTLHEKNLPFEVHEEKIGNFSERLKSLHPRPAVPLLIHENQVIYESAIITEYLNDQWKEPKLLPENALEKAQVRLLTHWCDHILKPEIDRFKYGPARLSPEEVNDATETIKNLLANLELRLADKPWLVGQEISLADIHLFPFYRQIARCNPAYPYLHLFPNLNQWLKNITNRPSFEKTMQKD